MLNADALQIDTILDEAKTMLRIGKYHDHIVNLQGITYEIDEQKTPEVSIILCISNEPKYFNVVKKSDEI